MTADDPAAAIAALFASEGAAEYFGESVTQAGHMLQAAALAERDHAARSLVRPRCCTTSVISRARSPATT